MNHCDRTGTIKIALVLVVLALAAVLNVLAQTAVERFSLKLDLTDSGLYELSELSLRTGELLDSPVSITVFNRRQDYPVMLSEIMARYDKLSNNITVSYRDPFENPLLVDRYAQQGVRIELNDLLIETGERYKHLTIDNLYTFNSSRTAVTSVRAEQQITAAIIQLFDDRIRTVRFTDGHNEQPSESLIELFGQNSYETGKINLSVTGIEADTDLIVIAAPERDFSSRETGMLDSYLNGGGDLMVFIPPSGADLKNLSAFLEKWGIVYGDAVVFEPRAHISDNPINIVPMYAQHEINTFFGDNRYFLMMPSSRIMRPAENSSFDLTVMTVLVSSQDSYARDGISFGDVQRSADDRRGPFHLALSSARPAGQNAESEESTRILALGSESIYADDILAMGSFANADFIIQAVNWLNPEQNSIYIPAKGIAPDPLTILPAEARAAGIVLGGVLPFLIISAGIAVVLRRRRS